MKRDCRAVGQSVSDGDMDHIHLYEEPEFDAETQERLDCQVDRLLKGYDWTLAPLANKSVPVLPDRQIKYSKNELIPMLFITPTFRKW